MKNYDFMSDKALHAFLSLRESNSEDTFKDYGIDKDHFNKVLLRSLESRGVLSDEHKKLLGKT